MSPTYPVTPTMDSDPKTPLRSKAQVIRANGITGKRETPRGTLYEPKPFAVQILCLCAGFLGGPALGWVLEAALQEAPSTPLLLYVPCTLVFFLGYGLWSARLAAIAFNMIGRSLLRVLLRIIVKRELPSKPEDILPDAEQLLHLAVLAQKAGWSFFVVSIPIALVAGVFSLLFGMVRIVVVLTATCLLWGYCLGTLGRRGYLPLPEAGD